MRTRATAAYQRDIADIVAKVLVALRPGHQHGVLALDEFLGLTTPVEIATRASSGVVRNEFGLVDIFDMITDDIIAGYQGRRDGRMPERLVKFIRLVRLLVRREAHRDRGDLVSLQRDTRLVRSAVQAIHNAPFA